MNNISTTHTLTEPRADGTSSMANVRKRPATALALVAILALSGCATGDQPRAQTGAVIGGLIGGVAGAVTGDRKGAVFGAVAGALVGGAAGNYQDQQQRDLEAQLAAEIAADMIQIQRLEDETLQVSLSNEATFDIGSSALKPGFLPALDRLSSVLQEYDKTAVHIIGHTDSTGTEAFNRALSRDRAASVATYVRDVGLDQRRLNIEGRGEVEPRKSNGSVAGRQANRRVELYLRPIIEGQQLTAYESPRYI